MNKYLIGFVLFTGLAFGQGKPKPTVCPGEPFKPFTVKAGDTLFSAAGVDVKPEFPGGFEAFNSAFGAEFKIPVEKPDLKGRIFIRFIVEKDGTLTNLKVLRDLGIGTGAEAIRVIKKMPKWKPAQHHKKAVRCDLSLPLKIPYEPTESALKLKVKEILDKR